jgi:integrase
MLGSFTEGGRDMAKRKNPGKRCRCNGDCSHGIWLRFKFRGERSYVNLSELFPGESIDVAAARAKDEVRRGLIVNGKRLNPTVTKPTVAGILERYRAAFADRAHHYAQALEPIAAVVADECTAADIKKCLALWMKRPRAGKSSTRHVLQLARHLFNWSIQEGLITRTPMATLQGVPLIKVPSSGHRSRRLEAGEAEKILAAAGPYINDFFTAMIETACRPGELRRLQWRDVHEDHIVVIAEKAKTRRGRQIPITPTLEKILDRRRTGPDGQAFSDDSFVFGDDVGHEVKRRRLHTWWAETCEAAKVTGLHLHDLRAEGGSQLLEAGVPIHIVRDALGHSNVSMTSTYLRGRSDSLADAYKRRHAQQARKRIKLAHVSHTSKRAKSV